MSSFHLLNDQGTGRAITSSTSGFCTFPPTPDSHCPSRTIRVVATKMCEWYRRNYACGHYFIGASEWCCTYSKTQRRCKVVVTQVDYDSSVCKSCMKKGAKTEVPWEHMIDRSKSNPNRDE
ncbi:hypothetical protein CI238_12771 [Colletotrichum incanum]|uniref:Uncharacterized protein n=1 Tax=Colletotrichum incanum TaxID=1573173 RepID=A0A167AEJ9_COLIC|nr:hypothetical protein CI238_12771 [Colletotrichum incanum]